MVDIVRTSAEERDSFGSLDGALGHAVAEERAINPEAFNLALDVATEALKSDPNNRDPQTIGRIARSAYEKLQEVLDAVVKNPTAFL